MDCRLALLLGLLGLMCSLASALKRPYIAAALEHARFGDEDDPPSMVVEENLKRYRKAAEIAASKGADIIVFPEYGLFPSLDDRFKQKPFMEDVPDPRDFRTNPCDEKSLYENRPILIALSCIAKTNSIFVVANMGDIKTCTGDPECRKDGFFFHNTNVVFDRQGTMLLRYYKEHLFYEVSIDLPKEQQDPTFETDFGTFATFVCYDIDFKRMSDVAHWPHVDGIMFPTMWFDANPQYFSTTLFQGWAIANNATIVVSNDLKPGWAMIGSGIFLGKHGALVYTFSADGISKIVMAEIPLSGRPEDAKTSIMAYDETKTWVWDTRYEVVPRTCSLTLLNETATPQTQYRCYEENTSNYTLVKLTEPSGSVEACNNFMCCSLTYSAEHMLEDFYLGVHNGTYNAGYPYISCEEDCFLTRCDAVGHKPCSTFPRTASTKFHYVDLKANFSTQYVYPSVVSSKARLVPMTDWEYDIQQDSSSVQSCIHFRSPQGMNLINVGFKARCFSRDPPFYH